ncbi:MAG: Fur family transcriptional regulator [Clostridia bacterium]|nr:transcriptional repressor [Clostridia bacterium]
MEVLLKNFNLKDTKNRKIILHILNNSIKPLSAEDIYKLVSTEKHNINLSTIYRTLNTLSEKQILIRQLRQDGKAYFQLNKHDHKHVLVCTICHKEVPISECPFESINKKISKSTGYTILSHNIEIFGICPDCSKKDQ